MNVSQIARLFGLNPSALANQLRNHYPEVLEQRERNRRSLGLNDNLHRGVKPWCKELIREHRDAARRKGSEPSETGCRKGTVEKI